MVTNKEDAIHSYSVMKMYKFDDIYEVRGRVFRDGGSSPPEFSGEIHGESLLFNASLSFCKASMKGFC
jgi:hypothetical protein